MAEKTPIVFIPGVSSSLRNHLPIMPLLWKHGSVQVVNQTQDDSIPAMAARVLREAPPKFALIGHSLGGYIALEIMRQAPERVTRLALTNTQARSDTPEVTERRKAQIEAAKNVVDYEKAMDALFALLVHPSRVNDAGLREQVRLSGIESGGPGTFIRHQKAVMARIDSRPFLAAIKVPTLVLSSDEDKLIPNALSHEMASMIPGAKLVIVPNAGHMTPIEQPEAVGAALDEWFAR
ncbi:MAG: alpha/beta hydrolase [Afipia sp.]|nr:alpha/beta hydrolase [Afipia sp.]